MTARPLSLVLPLLALTAGAATSMGATTAPAPRDARFEAAAKLSRDAGGLAMLVMLEGWAFPAELVARLSGRGGTCSGGDFGPGGFLYATGHDATELYVLEMPEAASTLKWIATVPITAEGQAFC